MSDILSGDLGSVLKYVVALTFVLGLLGGTLILVRRFSRGSAMGGTGGRGRLPRLAVLDHATVDARRRLVLVRRDHVEHLLLIGGPTDIVVEANIVRPAPPQREAEPAREAAATREALAEVRSTLVAEPAVAALQPPPEPIAGAPAVQSKPRRERSEPPASGLRPMMPGRPEPAPRPDAQLRPLPPLARPEPPAPPVPRAPVEPPSAPQAADPPAEPTAEFAELERLMQPPRVEDTRPKFRPTPASEDFAVRRESILKRPADKPATEPPRAPPRAAEPVIDSRPVPPLQAKPVIPPAPEAAAPDQIAKPAPTPAPTPAPEATAEPADTDTKSVFDNLEDEMASLLGRGGNRP